MIHFFINVYRGYFLPELNKELTFFYYGDNPFAHETIFIFAISLTIEIACIHNSG